MMSSPYVSPLSRALPVVVDLPPGNDLEHLGHLIGRLEAVLRRHPGADLPTAARELQLAARTLQRWLAQQGIAFQEVRRRVRLELACRLLAEPGSKVECVARDVGFASTPHFVGWFRRHRGASPSAWRRGHARAEAD